MYGETEIEVQVIRDEYFENDLRLYMLRFNQAGECRKLNEFN